jgi:hypothetical protein
MLIVAAIAAVCLVQAIRMGYRVELQAVPIEDCNAKPQNPPPSFLHDRPIQQLTTQLNDDAKLREAEIADLNACKSLAATAKSRLSLPPEISLLLVRHPSWDRLYDTAYPRNQWADDYLQAAKARFHVAQEGMKAAKGAIEVANANEEVRRAKEEVDKANEGLDKSREEAAKAKDTLSQYLKHPEFYPVLKDNLAKFWWWVWLLAVFLVGLAWLISSPVKPDLSFATALARGLEDPVGHAAYKAKWSHASLSSGLVNAVVLDPRFDALWLKHRKKVNASESEAILAFKPLTSDLEFRYLALSTADQRLLGRKSWQRFLESIKNVKPTHSVAEQSASSMSNAVTLLVILALLSGIGQVVSGVRAATGDHNDSSNTQQLELTMSQDQKATQSAIDSLATNVTQLTSQVSAKTVTETKTETVTVNGIPHEINIVPPKFELPPITVNVVPKDGQPPTPTPPAITSSAVNIELGSKTPTPTPCGEALAFFASKHPREEGVVFAEGTWTLQLDQSSSVRAWLLTKSWPPDAVKITATNGTNPSGGKGCGSKSNAKTSTDFYAGKEPIFNQPLNLDAWIEQKENYLWGGRRTLVVHIRPRVTPPELRPANASATAPVSEN